MSPTDETSERAREVVTSVMGDYASNRTAYFTDKKLLSKLLAKDHLLFALKGATSASEWLDAALSAHESSSEETVMGNTWQRILTELSRSVGAGDLLVEKDDVLWVVEMKSQTNTLNSSSTPQTLRSLKRKVMEHEKTRAPGRRGVMAMIGVIRGESKDEFPRFTASTQENKDIDGFQYRYMVGQPFRVWLTGMANPAELVADWRQIGADVSAARAVCKARLLGELRQILSSRGLSDDIASIIALAAPTDPQSAPSERL